MLLVRVSEFGDVLAIIRLLSPLPPSFILFWFFFSCVLFSFSEENIYKLCELIRLRGGNSALENTYAVFISNPHRSVMLAQQRGGSDESTPLFPVIWDYHVVLVRSTPFSMQSSLSSSPPPLTPPLNSSMPPLVQYMIQQEFSSTLSERWLVYDFDTRLPFPCPLQDYLAWTFLLTHQGSSTLSHYITTFHASTPSISFPSLPEHPLPPLKDIRSSDYYGLASRFPRFRPLFRVISGHQYLKHFASSRLHMIPPSHLIRLIPSLKPDISLTHTQGGDVEEEEGDSMDDNDVNVFDILPYVNVEHVYNKIGSHRKDPSYKQEYWIDTAEPPCYPPIVGTREMYEARINVSEECVTKVMNAGGKEAKKMRRMDIDMWISMTDDEVYTPERFMKEHITTKVDKGTNGCESTKPPQGSQEVRNDDAKEVKSVCDEQTVKLQHEIELTDIWKYSKIGRTWIDTQCLGGVFDLEMLLHVFGRSSNHAGT